VIVVPEDESASLVDEALALEAARRAFLASVGAVAFPSVIAHGSDPGNRFSVKSAASADVAGAKIGSYWPGNDALGLPRHNSLVLLFDQRAGRIGAVIEAGVANAYRTAAADALAVQVLAREDSRVLAVFGTGNQAFHECRALIRVRPLEEILVVGRSDQSAARLIARLRDAGIAARAEAPEPACARADLIVTATTSRAPLFEAGWVRPGTHVSCMGADARGKQELPPELFARASLFCDLPEQSTTLGELQHAGPACAPVMLGAVLAGTARGRRSAAEITVFDSSGIGLQDLALGLAILERRGTPLMS